MAHASATVSGDAILKASARLAAHGASAAASWWAEVPHHRFIGAVGGTSGLVPALDEASAHIRNVQVCSAGRMPLLPLAQTGGYSLLEPPARSGCTSK